MGKKAKPMENDLEPRAAQDEEWFTVPGAAQLLYVHPNTLRRWSDQGLITTYRFGPRGDRRFKREDIDKFLRASRRGKA